jgi:ATP-dependent RNA helicase SUPV3L1/SUV3
MQRPVTALLGPTNTGKTHLALERMLTHASGMIGFPLRLLARENYDRVVAQRGADRVALVTGEERIVPRQPAYWMCTVEAMPLDVRPDFLAVDEVQLAADRERGHVFTQRIQAARGPASCCPTPRSRVGRACRRCSTPSRSSCRSCPGAPR